MTPTTPTIDARIRASFAGRRVMLAVTLVSALCWALHAAPAALANSSQISIMMDDDRVVYAQQDVQLKTLQSMKNLGVTLVRATVLWSDIAKGTRAPSRKNRRFNPAISKTYPRGAWADYDRLVQDAAAVGIGVYFDVTGPGPSWAMGKTSNKKLAKAFMPDPAQFGKFVQAIGSRYSGTYPNGAGRPGTLPRMSVWSIWNEPNWPTWLAPQSVYSPQLHQVLPFAPILYRELFYAARRALDVTGHKKDYVMLGETQPLGLDPKDAGTPMRPAEFIRELFCVGRSLRPLTGLQASVRHCDQFNRGGAFRISAFAHHPYTKSQPPTWTDPNRDSITLGNITTLAKLLDGIARSTRRVPSKLPIMATEMGYSTDPPNPFRGVPADPSLGTADSLATQAAYINESDYLAYKQSRVASMTQFEYRDSGPVTSAKKGSRAYWATFQTGLVFFNGQPKPSYNAYAFPFWIHRGHDSNGNKQLELWAQVRFRRYASSSDVVFFQAAPPGSNVFTTITSLIHIDKSLGFVDVIVPQDPYYLGGTYRAVWGGPVAPYFDVSRTVAVP